MPQDINASPDAPPSPSDTGHPPRRRLVYWNMLVIAALAGSLLLLVALEWEHYRRELEWSRLRLSVWLRVLLGWELWVKSLLLLTPALGLGGLLIWRGRHRGGYVLFALLGVLTWCWLALDAHVSGLTGRHVLEYARYAGEKNALDWAGGWGVVWPALGLLAAVIAAALALLSSLRFLMRPKEGDDHGVTRWLPTWVLLLAVLLLPVAQRLSPPGSRRHFARLAGELPLPMPWLGGGGPRRGAQEGFCVEFERELLARYAPLQPRLASFTPPDRRRPFEPDPSRPLPNVIVLLIESLRHDAVGPELMKRIDAAAQRGLRGTRHYACANNSVLGSYGLLHGRAGFTFMRDMADAGEPVTPQFVLSLRALGYRGTVVSSSTTELSRWEKMGTFFNDRVFDEVVNAPAGGRLDWPRFDAEALEHIHRVVTQRGADDPPRLVVGYLMSTHFDYRYPPAEEIFTPVLEGALSQRKLNRKQAAQRLLNRYRNAAAFMDRIVGQLLERIDLERNLVVILGDHGQSIWDDGYLAHDSVLSDIQTRTPLVMVGAGLEPTVLQRMSSHQDVLPTVLHVLAGRPVEIAHTHGRDLLSPATGPDRVVCVRHHRGRRWHLLMIEGDHRFLATLDLASPQVRAVGFVDVHMTALPEVPPGQDPVDWAQRFERYLSQRE